MVQQNILDAPITTRPRHMLEMAVTPQEMSNISSQLPLEVTMSHMLHYDPEHEVLHYGMEIANLVEAADRKVTRKRVPGSVTLLQAHLELIARKAVQQTTEFVNSLDEPEASVMRAMWRFAPMLRRDDDRICKVLMGAGITDIDEFFIAAAKRK